MLALDAEARILVVRQYRYAADTVCTELPGGVVDAGEEPLEAAQRELLKETGYRAEQWMSAGSLFANPARQTNRIHLFIATQLAHSSDRGLDTSEKIVVQFLSQKAVQVEIDGGTFSHALHVSSYYRGIHKLSTTTDVTCWAFSSHLFP